MMWIRYGFAFRTPSFSLSRWFISRSLLVFLVDSEVEDFVCKSLPNLSLL